MIIKNVQKVAFLWRGGKNPRGIFLKHVQKVVFWKIYENVPFVAFHGGTERFNGKNSRFLREKGELMERIPLLLGKTPFLCHNMKAKSLSMVFTERDCLGGYADGASVVEESSAAERRSVISSMVRPS